MISEGQWEDFLNGPTWRELEGYLRDRREILRNDLEVSKEKPLTPGEFSTEHIQGQIHSLKWLMMIPGGMKSVLKAKREADEAQAKQGEGTGDAGRESGTKRGSRRDDGRGRSGRNSGA